MGWLFKQGYDKTSLIQHLVKPEENEQRRWETLAHCVRGNVLWSVISITEKQANRSLRIIACHLLASHGDGYGWGYKDMDESMHPYYYSCPLKYLEMVPDVANESWRQGVRDYHRLRNVNVGQKVALIGTTIPWVNIVSCRPLIGEHDGIRYRVPQRLLGEVI